MVTSVPPTPSTLLLMRSFFIRNWLLIAILVAIGSVYTLLNSKRVNDILFAINDEPLSYYEHGEFPLSADRIVSLSEWTKLQMPQEVQQPSGVGVTDDQVVFATDMATTSLGSLDAINRMVTLESTQRLRRLPLLLRQGYLEAATFGATPDVIFIAGGNNQLFQVRVQNNRTLRIVSQVSLTWPNSQGGSPEIAGLAFYPVTGTLFATYAVDGEAGVQVAEFTAAGQFLKTLTLHSNTLSTLQFSTQMTYANAAGISVAGDNLLVLSDRHSSLMWFDIETGLLRETWGLKDLPYLSGVAYSNGRLFALQDHEYHQEVPPLRMLTLTDLPK